MHAHPAYLCVLIVDEHAGRPGDRFQGGHMDTSSIGCALDILVSRPCETSRRGRVVSSARVGCAAGSRGSTRRLNQRRCHPDHEAAPEAEHRMVTLATNETKRAAPSPWIYLLALPVLAVTGNAFFP